MYARIAVQLRPATGVGIESPVSGILRSHLSVVLARRDISTNQIQYDPDHIYSNNLRMHRAGIKSIQEFCKQSKLDKMLLHKYELANIRRYVPSQSHLFSL